MELHELWNFGDWLRPYHNIPKGSHGFCTNSQSSGMHEFIFEYDDKEKNVRFSCRQSSQSSTFFPEGRGYL